MQFSCIISGFLSHDTPPHHFFCAAPSAFSLARKLSRLACLDAFAGRQPRPLVALDRRGLGLGGCVMSMVILDDFCAHYRGQPALLQVSGEIATGSLTAVVGPNGAGKSTLCKSLLGLHPASGGTLKVAAKKERIAYLPQQAQVDRGFPISVRDCALLGTWPATGALGGVGAERQKRVDQALETVGLADLARRPVGALSVGQFQRLLFARVLVQDAELILLDEPFNAVDSRTTRALLGLVQQWHAEGRTVVAVLHDAAQVAAHFPQTLLLSRSVVAWGATAEVMTPQHLARAQVMAEHHADHHTHAAAPRVLVPEGAL
jgi:zinc/manganese transport system ATP-binding protein